MYSVMFHVRFGFMDRWGRDNYYDVFGGHNDDRSDTYDLLEEDISEWLSELIKCQGIGADEDVENRNTDKIIRKLTEKFKQFKVEIEVFYEDGKVAKRTEFVKDYSSWILEYWTAGDSSAVEGLSTDDRNDNYRRFMSEFLKRIVEDAIVEDMTDALFELLK